VQRWRTRRIDQRRIHTRGEREPIGQCIQFGNMDGDLHIQTIVGVVGDMHERQLECAPSGTIYVDLQQRPKVAAAFNIVLRSTLATSALMSELRGSLQQRASFALVLAIGALHGSMALMMGQREHEFALSRDQAFQHW
jgi:hypothetical protein